MLSGILGRRQTGPCSFGQWCSLAFERYFLQEVPSKVQGSRIKNPMVIRKGFGPEPKSRFSGYSKLLSSKPYHHDKSERVRKISISSIGEAVQKHREGQPHPCLVRQVTST